MRSIFAALLVLVTLPAFAQTGSAILSCTPPTTNTDGTAIAGTVTYKFYRGTTATSQTTVSTAQTSCSYTWTGLSAGTHYFSATATVNGVESARSNVASKTIAFTPSPPTGLTVLADTVAYETRSRWGNLFVWRDAGTVLAGTSCDSAVRVGQFYGVPRESVVYRLRPNRELSAVVVAECG